MSLYPSVVTWYVYIFTNQLHGWGMYRLRRVLSDGELNYDFFSAAAKASTKWIQCLAEYTGTNNRIAVPLDSHKAVLASFVRLQDTFCSLVSPIQNNLK